MGQPICYKVMSIAIGKTNNGGIPVNDNALS